ncbi:MAG: response regulator [Immundisolibacteraceae bacterium]|nr:response regulator [Immundisolibacteraceae bacterium]
MNRSSNLLLRLWQNRSLVSKVSFVGVFVLAVTATISSLYLGDRWVKDKEAGTRQLLEIVAGVVGANSSAALVFKDTRAASETLRSLANYGAIKQAVLYDSDQQFFAAYRRADIKTDLSVEPMKLSGFYPSGKDLTFYQPITLDRDLIGTLMVRADMGHLRRWIAETSRWFFLVVLAAVILALCLTYLIMRSLIIHPLEKVLNAMAEIADNRDYSVRLIETRTDELGSVIQGFNKMVATVEEHEADLQKAVGNAERAGQAKSIFLANMSHELRTPLNGVLGMAELLQRTSLTSAQNRYVEQTRNSGKDLLAILNDILDFSKIEAQKVELESICFDFNETLEMVVGLFQQQADSKKISLSLEFDPQLPRWLIGDPVRIRQILINLISNAVKFTHQGGIKVEVLGRVDGGFGDLEIRVTDTGIGIEASVIPSLFGAFSQADSSTTRRYGGTGLGLAIASQLSLLMSGEIQVKSELGSGTVFTLFLRLPLEPERSLQRESDDQIVEIDTKDQIVKSVLLAEDNKINQALARAMLEEMGHEVTAVDDGEQALECLQDQQFDLVLMDGEMPGIDGYEVTRQLRQIEELKSKRRQPVVALTANALSGARDQCLAAGMDDYLSKPYSYDQLRLMVERWAW